MGTDKALLRVDGVAMARRVADALVAGGCVEVAAVGGDGEGLAALGLCVVPDVWPGEGPLGGVVAALRQWPDADAVVVVACDLPRLTGRTVAALATALVANPDAAAAVGVTDRRQPMCSAWRPSAAVHLGDALERGERRLHTVLQQLRTVEVALPATELLNVNAPGDLPSSL